MLQIKKTNKQKTLIRRSFPQQLFITEQSRTVTLVLYLDKYLLKLQVDLDVGRKRLKFVQPILVQCSISIPPFKRHKTFFETFLYFCKYQSLYLTGRY